MVDTLIVWISRKVDGHDVWARRAKEQTNKRETHWGLYER